MDVTTCHVFVVVRPSLAFESLNIVGAKMAESNPRSESLVAECTGEC